MTVRIQRFRSADNRRSTAVNKSFLSETAAAAAATSNALTHNYTCCRHDTPASTCSVLKIIILFFVLRVVKSNVFEDSLAPTFECDVKHGACAALRRYNMVCRIMRPLYARAH